MAELRTYWDKVAEKGLYQMGSVPHRIAILERLAHLQCKSFLDVGCGTGPLYQLLMDAPLGKYLPVVHYKGVDYSEGMIEKAKEKFPDADFEVEDARSLDEPANAFDAVVLMDCINHVNNYQKVLIEAYRVSRKYVFITLWRAFVESEENNLNIHNSMERETGEWEDTYLHDFNKQKLLNAFMKANLAIKEEIFFQENNHRLYILEKTEI